jgi:acetyltransferase-like isoleucine patch superfamily enzyme
VVSWKYPKIEHNKLTKYNWVVLYPENLKLGKNTDIGAFTLINAKCKVIIEPNVQIGPHCSIMSVSTIDNKRGPIIISKGTKIGSHCIIMPNTIIGENTMVGAHSFVNRDLEPNSLYFGVPAKYIKKLS